jgi:hypothetical protein
MKLVDTFQCEHCKRVFPTGDDTKARAEAVSRGFDPDDDCVLLCDECDAMVAAWWEKNKPGPEATKETS